MEARITEDVLESYLFCKYKSYLKIMGQHGNKSDYETLLTEIRSEVRLNAIDKIHLQNQENQVVSNITLSTSALEQGPPFILEAILEDDRISLSIDGLKKVPGASKLGQFIYIPILFHAKTRVGKEQKLLLEVEDLFLFQFQGIASSRGIIWHGRDCKATTVHLNPDLRKVKQILVGLKKMCSAETPPRLILNEHCQICEFCERCQAQAMQEDNLSLLQGMSEKEIKGYNRKGILTVTQLAHMFRPRRKGKRNDQQTKHRYFALQALALRDKKIYVFGTSDLRQGPVHIYLDIESEPEAGFVYLIGLIVVENGLETRYSFWADKRDQEPDIFEQFVAEVTRHEDFVVFCYGSYERAFITRMRKTAKSQDLVDKILNALVNILSYIYAHIYLPTYSNSLKEIGRCVGGSWTESQATGIQSIVWRSKWEADHDENWKWKLVTYNLEDCTALKKVTEILRAITIRTSSRETSLTQDKDNPSFVLVKDIEKLTDFHLFGQVNFVHPDYEFVNNCAYFDYQRERVYIRTSDVLRKNRASKPYCLNSKLEISEQTLIVAAQCPVCGSKKIVCGVHKEGQTQGPRLKRVFDLEFTSTGVSRRVLAYRTSFYQCSTCGEVFLPDQYERLDKHFHGLKSWAMYQHVEHRMSLRPIAKMCEELFGIRIFHAETLMFKFLMARYYESTYQRLLEKIISGALLHVDETEVQLRNGKGYVWVFANIEEVVYMYRPTREGDFLRELLKNFHGVLVSDFYAAYDSIECHQQKCLIHLMRDINQELLDNPFDEELKSITQPFGVLLRKIITTVDEQGLRRQYLQQHEGDVEQFFRSLEEKTLTSDPAEALRARLTKNRNKLFTFLNNDGIPWNNNNAEHAIKQFVYYRESTIGTMKESGLGDYLVLLSISQTCKYKGLSFLKFLLSKEQDVDVFWQKKTQGQCLSSIELYPEGFVPRHLRSVYKKKAPQEQGGDPIPMPTGTHTTLSDPM